MLVLIELFGLGWFGLDRCYMGQHVFGLVKALTGGGLAVWALLDYIVVVFNCFSQAKSIDVVGNSDFSFGLHASAEKDASWSEEGRV